jgi:hypothetical protein
MPPSPEPQRPGSPVVTPLQAKKKLPHGTQTSDPFVRSAPIDNKLPGSERVVVSSRRLAEMKQPHESVLAARSYDPRTVYGKMFPAFEDAATHSVHDTFSRAHDSNDDRVYSHVSNGGAHNNDVDIHTASEVDVKSYEQDTSNFNKETGLNINHQFSSSTYEAQREAAEAKAEVYRLRDQGKKIRQRRQIPINNNMITYGTGVQGLTVEERQRLKAEEDRQKAEEQRQKDEKERAKHQHHPTATPTLDAIFQSTAPPGPSPTLDIKTNPAAAPAPNLGNTAIPSLPPTSENSQNNQKPSTALQSPALVPLLIILMLAASTFLLYGLHELAMFRRRRRVRRDEEEAARGAQREGVYNPFDFSVRGVETEREAVVVPEKAWLGDEKW